MNLANLELLRELEGSTKEKRAGIKRLYKAFADDKYRYDELKRRQGVVSRLEQADGQWLALRWERDCDMVEGYSLEFLSCPFEYFVREEGMHHWAEGPCWMSPISEQDAREFVPTRRDRILEAFEDGRGNHVVI